MEKPGDFSDYSYYLMSEDWEKKRETIIARDNHMCVVCKRRNNLQVHHLTYKNIYHEQDRDLITLCRDCHATYHEVERRTNMVNLFYWRMESSKVKEDHNKNRIKWNDRERQRLLLTKKICDKYLQDDLCMGGSINMCNWETIKKLIEEETVAADIDQSHIPTPAAVHQRFCYERYVVLLRLLNQGLDKKGIRAATNLTPQFINKWCGDREYLVSAINNYEANERRIEEGLY